MKRIFLLLLTVILSVPGFGQIKKETYVYSVKGHDTLRLDRYTAPVTHAGELRPCLMFMFGGGFYTGTRDNKIYIPYFEYYASAGYDVVSIDYRLGLKGKNMNEVHGVKQLISLLDSTVTIAVEDLYDATNFILNKSTEWSINQNFIITSGSSAGAISVLQGEYNIANGTMLSRHLPDGFRYAGVIGFAGAIFSPKGKIKWTGKPAPIQMFHGNSDSNVPYRKFTIFGKGFYGSEFIAETLDKGRQPYYFCTFDNANHIIATSPMNDNRYDIDDFLQKMVLRHQSLIVNKNIDNTSLPIAPKKFSIKDYIRANFAPVK